MGLHLQAQRAYGPGLGSSYQQAVNIKQGLGVIQQQKSSMAEQQRRAGAEQGFARMASQFKGNPTGALDYMIKNRLISPVQYTNAMRGIQDLERKREEAVQAKAEAQAKAQAEAQAQAQAQNDQLLGLAQASDFFAEGDPEAARRAAVLRGGLKPGVVDVAYPEPKSEPPEIKPEIKSVYDKDRNVWVFSDGRVVAPQGLPSLPAKDKKRLKIGPIPFQKKVNELDEHGLRLTNTYELDLDDNGQPVIDAQGQPVYIKKHTGRASASDPRREAVVSAAEMIVAGKEPPDWQTKRGAFRSEVGLYIKTHYPNANIKELMGSSKFRMDAPTNRAISVLRSIVDPQPDNDGLGKAKSILREYEKAHEELELTDFPLANAVKLRWLEQTGDERVKRYNNLRIALAMEFGQAMGAAALTDKRLEMEVKQMAESASPSQVRAIADTLESLARARLRQFESEQGRPSSTDGASSGRASADTGIAAKGVQAILPDGTIVTSDGKGGWK